MLSPVSAIRLFVYGSLKRGCLHHALLEGARFEGSAETLRGYGLVLQGSYPALVCCGTGTVRGEVYHVSDELLSRLDLFEGCPELYQRSDVRLSDGTTAVCYVIDPERAAASTELTANEWQE